MQKVYLYRCQKCRERIYSREPLQEDAKCPICGGDLKAEEKK